MLEERVRCRIHLMKRDEMEYSETKHILRTFFEIYPRKDLVI